MNNILFLYSRLNGFVLSVARHIAVAPECGSVRIVYWDDAKDIGNKFTAESRDGVEIWRRSGLSRHSIVEMIAELCPAIIYLSGWMDKEYVAAIRLARKRGMRFRTVCGIDDQWFGRPRQIFGSAYFRLFYKDVYDFMWVAGKPQYHYARMMGYPHDRIISNLLSADSSKFHPVKKIEKRFVFLGRFERIKGLDVLIAAHEALPTEQRAEWPLVLIGDGELRALVEASQSQYLRFVPYLQPDALAVELGRGGVGILPSTFEAWSVALHELALMGFPLIASKQCGAASEFLIHGYNGYLFNGGDVAGLNSAMRTVISLSEEQRSQLGLASIALGARITPEASARSLLSLIASPPLP